MSHDEMKEQLDAPTSREEGDIAQEPLDALTSRDDRTDGTMIVAKPCNNEDCDLCYPIPRFKIVVERVQRLYHTRTIKAATPEAALRAYHEGTEWPSSYDDRSGEVLEEHAPVVTVEEPRSDRVNAGLCYHNLPAWPGLSSCDFVGDEGCTDPTCVKCHRPPRCETCGETYTQPSSARASLCSNAFHCCRDCTWEEGRRVVLCAWHARDEEALVARLVPSHVTVDPSSDPAEGYVKLTFHAALMATCADIEATMKRLREERALDEATIKQPLDAPTRNT